MLTQLLISLGQFSIQVILFLGYPGILILMAMESMIVPLPSELVMPFAGFLISEARFTFLGVLIASSLGSLFGSILSYYIGKHLGRPIIIRYGRYFLLNEQHLEITDRFFAKKGEKAVLISRFIPVVRHLISIPAGIARMNIKKFAAYTLIGAAIWNMFLAFLGFKLKNHWDLIHSFSKELDILVIIILIIVIIYFAVKRFRKK